MYFESLTVNGRLFQLVDGVEYRKKYGITNLALFFLPSKEISLQVARSITNKSDWNSHDNLDSYQGENGFEFRSEHPLF
jgi:hypothetical protein